MYLHTHTPHPLQPHPPPLLPAAVACKRDITKHCSKLQKEEGEEGEGAVLLCLREHREKLRPACQARGGWGGAGEGCLKERNNYALWAFG